jgi:unsaturated rhamnogalacturonyl hydrolase
MSTPKCLCLLIGITCLAAGARGQEADVYSPAEIHRLMVLVNNWQLAHPTMKPTDRNWERATWYTGVMAAYKATRDPRFLDQAMAWGKLHQWQVGTETSGSNRLFCVETWAELGFETKDKTMIEPAIKWLDTPAPNSPAGAKVWYFEDGRRYADSLYGAPALAMLARATGDHKYIDFMNAFWQDVSDEIFDKDEGLYYRDKRFIGQKSPAGRKVFWSRGNGWVMGGIVRVLEYLPEDEPSRAKYVELLKTMSAAVAKRQGADGLWRPNLDDPDHVPFPESSGTGFFCYAMTWGINHGILDRTVYEPVARKAWKGLAGVVSAEGKVQWGQPVGDRPANVKEALTHEYVSGTFLLAGSEMYRLAGGKPLKSGDR